MVSLGVVGGAWGGEWAPGICCRLLGPDLIVYSRYTLEEEKRSNFVNILCFYTVEQHHEKACNLKPVISCSRLLLRYATNFKVFQSLHI